MVTKNPLLHPLSILIVALALSIGWGIRGNYGHETGAMFPGAVAAIAACLLSGRQDWHSRVAYFGLFGMLGWAFGGSVSYMMVIGYTQSGHSSSQLFGFAGLFFIGFLWASFGGAGTALPAALTDKQLRSLFVPLTVVLGVWLVLYFAKAPLMDGIQYWLKQDGVDSQMRRQEHVLYWLDSDWFQVCLVLASLLVLDLATRRFEQAGWLVAYAAIGGVVCYLIFLVLDKTTGNEWIARFLVQHQGMYEDRYSPEQLIITNWPRLFLSLGQRHGLLYQGESLALWGGALLGVTCYCLRYGRFEYGSGLFIAMAVGWLIGFVLLPVLGSLFLPQYGGLRMTPPRGDNWAGVLGALVGALGYCWRNNLRSVAVAAVFCGALGGVAFSGAAWIEGLLVSFGNRNLAAAPELWDAWQQTAWQPDSWTGGQRMPAPDFLADLETPTGWAAWQGQNWHSFLEQLYGFLNGIAVALTMAVLAVRLPTQEPTCPGKSWMLLLSLIVSFPVLLYLNMTKNLGDWLLDYGGHQPMPAGIAIPWTSWQLSTPLWFGCFWLCATGGLVILFIAHRRRSVAVVPGNWIGRGQMLFLAIMWAFVIGNFTRALPSFGEQRMLTEGIIYLNAVLVSVLILLAPALSRQAVLREQINLGRLSAAAVTMLLVLAVVMPSVEWWTIRKVYGNAQSGKRGMDFRFGPNANWSREPLLKGELHR